MTNPTSGNEGEGVFDLLTKAVGDISAALIFAQKQDQISEWVAPYVSAINDHDAYALTPAPFPLAGEGTLGSLDKMVQRSIMASAALGAWMSAALDDPAVCDAMKADIREWFSAGEPELVQYARAAIAAIPTPAPVPHDLLSGTTPQKVWDCKIGVLGSLDLPSGADFPMRQAIAAAFEQITGREAQFCFSGWGGKLDEYELAVVEKRLPVIAPDVAAENARLLTIIAKLDKIWSRGSTNPNDARSGEIRPIWHDMRAAIARAKAVSK